MVVVFSYPIRSYHRLVLDDVPKKRKIASVITFIAPPSGDLLACIPNGSLAAVSQRKEMTSTPRARSPFGGGFIVQYPIKNASFDQLRFCGGKGKDG